MCLLLEGLWGNWGFYFTAHSQPKGVGSSDLEQTLQGRERLRRLTPLSPDNRATALPENENIAFRRFLQVLYAQTVIFRVFLKCASVRPGRITEDHKGHWLLLQVTPETLLGKRNVFSALTQLLERAPLEYLRESVQRELNIIDGLFGPRPLTLFCVLDEAQVPMNLFSDCFLSGTQPAKPRPTLRPIILTWTSVLPNLIISGTGVSMQDSETVLVSAVAKESGPPPPEMVTDLGAFDNEEDQRAYLEYYLPPGFLETDGGKAMASWEGYWLHGRCVNNA
jgi:hypothetical protein